MNIKDTEIKQENSENQEPIYVPQEDKTGYDFLYEMCKNVRNKGHARIGLIEPMTDRVCYIVNQLNEMGLSYRTVPFSIENRSETGYGKGKMMNVEVFFPATIKTDVNIFFTAHHDIANHNSENCQDNTASVCNLLDLCKRLNKSETRNSNVYVVFTDCEETGGLGMDRLLYDVKRRNITINEMYCLELTANGNQYWVAPEFSKKENVATERFFEVIGNRECSVRTPYNESVNARYQNINAVCIGSLSEQEMMFVKSSNYCETWSLCHRKEDTFEQSANREDMSNFVDFMLRIINE